MRLDGALASSGSASWSAVGTSASGDGTAGASAVSVIWDVRFASRCCRDIRRPQWVRRLLTPRGKVLPGLPNSLADRVGPIPDLDGKEKQCTWRKPPSRAVAHLRAAHMLSGPRPNRVNATIATERSGARSPWRLRLRSLLSMTASPRVAYLQQRCPAGGVAEPAARPMRPKRLWPLRVRRRTTAGRRPFQVRSGPSSCVQVCDNLQKPTSRCKSKC